MNHKTLPTSHWSAPLAGLWWRFAATGILPAHLFLPLPKKIELEARTGHLKLEVVSHCWNYSNLLAYQLSSLILTPPTNLSITMTVFYAEEDKKTTELLSYFEQKQVSNVTWNWSALPRDQLFRRGIGRNLAAKQTTADWIWFTDCDLVFHADCLEHLAKLLQGRTDPLIYPKIEHTTTLLSEDDPMLTAGAKPQVLRISTTDFRSHNRDRATGPLQITHGDIAREVGYCDAIALYQTPSNVWCKAYEDRAFRWILGTQGKAIDLPGVFRIRHIFKGRYTGSSTSNNWRTWIRRISSTIKGQN